MKTPEGTNERNFRKMIRKWVRSKKLAVRMC